MSGRPGDRQQGTVQPLFEQQLSVAGFWDHNDLFTLPDTDPNLDPCTNIGPKNGYNKDRGSGSESESESDSVQWEQFLDCTM